MTSVSLRQILEAFSSPSLAEALAPWLLNLDENQDGQLADTEIQDSEGHLRCDFRMNGMGQARWKKLEKILVGESLARKRPKACSVEKGEASPRLPTDSARLYRSESYDYVFQLGKGIGLQSVLDIFQNAGYSVQQGKKSYDATLPSGRMIRLETYGKSLQKIHYLDAQGEGSMLCRLEFWELLQGLGRLEEFYASNPYYDFEREVWGRYYSVVYTYAKTPTLSLDQAKDWKGVLLFPDYHGTWKRYEALEKLVREEKMDWLALEMLPHSLQAELDTFLTDKIGSKDWVEARRKIQAHLQPFWAKYFDKMKDPEGNPYYKLLLLCRKRKIKVHALDTRVGYTIAGDRKFTPMHVGTRNRVWAEHIPEKGRGIVYGGEAHFTGFPKVRVQDFLWEENPKRKITLLSF